MVHRLSILSLTLVWLLSACQTTPTPIETALATEPSTQGITAEPTTEVVSTPLVTQEALPVAPTETVLPVDEVKLPVWANSDSAIFQSLDGGNSWQDITPASLREQLAIAGEGMGATLKADFSKDGFGLAAISQTQQAVIYRTQDGGKTWEESQLVYEEEVQGIIALETYADQLGWLLVSRGVGAGNEWVDLYHTQDGGMNWSYQAWSNTETDVYGSIPSGGLKSGISFNSPERGWISGSAPIDAVYLFRTLDGGQTWQPYNLPLPEGVAFSGQSSVPIFFDEQQGVLTASVYTNTDAPGLVFFISHDGGETWQPTRTLEGQFTAWNWFDVHHGFAVETTDDGQTSLFATQDGGDSWEAHLIDLKAVSKLEFTSPQVGWAICGWSFAPEQDCTGDLYRTLDGGRSWEKVFP